MTWASKLALCALFAAGAVQGADLSSSGGAEGCDADEEDAALLQVASVGHRWGHRCSTRSLVAGLFKKDEEDSYLQWNAHLTAAGADQFEFLYAKEVERENKKVLRFVGDVEFVEHGKPVYGIVLLRLQGKERLRQKDALKLKEYIDAGGMLVLGEQTTGQVNKLMKDLGSSIRVRTGINIPGCSSPEEAPYVPVHGSRCSLTNGVTGLQGSTLDRVLDEEDSSDPLFVLNSDPSYVVARAEKHRSLVVVGDDEPFDDACVIRQVGGESVVKNTRAFGPTTNLRFFTNLFQKRCAHR